MLKPYHSGAILLIMALSNNALAVDCIDDTKLTSSTSPTLTVALADNTICVGSVGSWAAQEQHRGGNELWDYKHGPISPSNLNDPTDIIGTWVINGNDTVTYTYHQGAAYTYTLHKLNDSYTFCGTTNTNATIRDYIGAC